jgi:hypothetical protein
VYAVGEGCCSLALEASEVVAKERPLLGRPRLSRWNCNVRKVHAGKRQAQSASSSLVSKSKRTTGEEKKKKKKKREREGREGNGKWQGKKERTTYPTLRCR